MKKFEGFLLCTDLDGTLLRNDKTISKENLRAIDYFKQEGGLFTFVTGRMPFYISDLCEIVKPNAPFGCVNGGGVYDYTARRYLWTKPLSRRIFELLAYAQERFDGIGYQVTTFDRTYFCSENSAMAEFRRLTGVPNLTCRFDEVEEPIAKIVFGEMEEDRVEVLKAILHAHPLAKEFDFVRSEKILYEILPKNINKGVSLTKLTEQLCLDPNKTIAVGDYHNDIPMLRVAKLGVAVANACPEAKAAANYITVSNEEHAIANIVEELERGVLPL